MVLLTYLKWDFKKQRVNESCPPKSLDVSFHVTHEGHYMVYASSSVMKCFECGHVWREEITCPYREQEAEVATAAAPSLLLYVEAGSAAWHYYTASDYLSFVESVFQNRNQYCVEEINSFFGL